MLVYQQAVQKGIVGSHAGRHQHYVALPFPLQFSCCPNALEGGSPDNGTCHLERSTGLLLVEEAKRFQGSLSPSSSNENPTKELKKRV